MANPNGVPRHSKRSVLVSSSATMFVTSVDKVASFPPPIKVITKYNGVHHARILGTHLFNVDFTNAVRETPKFLRKDDDQVAYRNGCPFYRDYQREFLMMPVGLQADVVGVLVMASATDGVPCVVLTNEKQKKSFPIKFLGNEHEFQSGKKHLGALRTTLKAFCNDPSSNDEKAVSGLIKYFSFKLNNGRDALHNYKLELLRRSGKSPDFCNEVDSAWEALDTSKIRNDGSLRTFNNLYKQIDEQFAKSGLQDPSATLTIYRQQLFAILDQISKNGNVKFFEYKN
ncbi:MAG: hypothetical protein LBI81_03325 [Puniceicoccales bacterium]|nr:hypothetical protein [Puniceicoccales bacterium]